MPRKGLWRVLAPLLAATLVLAACGGDDDDTTAGGTDTTAAGGEKKEFALAFVGPLTGPNANLGINIRDGMRVALEEANEEHEDFNFTIKEFDTQGDPAQAPGQKDKYIPDDSIIAVVGPTFSGETRAVLPDLQQAGLVMISASATNVMLPTDPATDVFHRIIPDDGVQAQGIAEYVTSKLKPKKIALIHDNTDYGKGLWEGVVKLLTDAGIDTSTTDAIDPKSQNYSVAVNKVKAANVDMVFYGGYYNEAGRLKKQLADAEVDSTFISGDGSLDPGFVVSSGAPGGEGALLTCPCRLATPDIEGAPGEFATKYKEVVGKDPGTYSSEGYDAANILIDGIVAGNDTREKLLAYVEGFEGHDGISKRVEFEANGNVKAGDVFVYEVKGGKITELGKTSELKG
jgi:branched-chain amino acid transport system substrate-binding protein